MDAMTEFQGNYSPFVRRRGLKLRTCFVLFNYLLGAIALASLALSEVFPNPVNNVLLALLFLCYVLEANKAIPIAPPTSHSLTKWGIPLVPLAYFAFNPPLLQLVTGFLLLLFFSRFIFKTELNDYLYGYLIAIICLLLGAIFIRDLVFLGIFLSFYLVLCWSLIFYNMMVERAGSSAPPARFKPVGEHDAAGMTLLGVSAGMMLLSLAFTALIFVTFPRLGLGFMSLTTKSSPISGFSETVQLGDVGKIKLNPQVVMRIEFKRNGLPFRPPARILWRGVALDRYDGKAWTSTMPLARQLRNRAGGVSLFSPTALTGDTIQEEVFMEAFDSDVVFTYGVPLRMSGNFRQINMDQSFAIKTADADSGPRHFFIAADIAHPETNHADIAPEINNPDFLRRFLQKPADLSSQIAGLARDLTRFAFSDEARARNILEYFHKDFGYSLEMVHETDKPGLDEFLFQRKKGHCEYFASAMVVLLRAAGIPARLVNGFAGSEWNGFGNYMIVRESHAHSWVEAFIRGKGWTIYDPTPPDPGGGETGQTRLGLYLDFIRLNWQRYVIRYSIADQVRLVSWFRGEGVDFAHKLKSLKSMDAESVRRMLHESRMWVLGVLAAGGLYLAARRVTWGRGGLTLRAKPPFAVALYRNMLRRLEKSGIHKQPYWTHREFLRHLDRLPPEKQRVVLRVSLFYETSRFANRSAPEEERREMQACLRDL